MTLRSLISIVVASYALLACGQSTTGGGGVAAAECKPNSCQIKVTVANNCNTADDITVDPPTMPVPRENHQLKMHWEIVTSGFTFVTEPDGITFTTPPLPPAEEFHDPNATAGGTKYNLTNANNTTETYKYNIRLLRSNGQPCPVKDPFIKNGA